jgi:hypothetical protein
MRSIDRHQVTIATSLGLMSRTTLQEQPKHRGPWRLSPRTYHGNMVYSYTVYAYGYSTYSVQARAVSLCVHDCWIYLALFMSRYSENDEALGAMDTRRDY